jgi:hypothetical protein
LKKRYRDALKRLARGGKNGLVTLIVKRIEIFGELVNTWGNPLKGSYGHGY